MIYAVAVLAYAFAFWLGFVAGCRSRQYEGGIK